MSLLIVVVVGLAAGFLGGLLGVGGGILLVPAFLFFLRDQITDMKMAVGTSMAVIVAVAVIGTIEHARGGRVNWRIVPVVAAFAMIGSYTGARLTSYIATAWLRRIFALLLIAVALKMFFTTDRKESPAPVAPPEETASREQESDEQILTMQPPRIAPEGALDPAAT